MMEVYRTVFCNCHLSTVINCNVMQRIPNCRACHSKATIRQFVGLELAARPHGAGSYDGMIVFSTFTPSPTVGTSVITIERLPSFSRRLQRRTFCVAKSMMRPKVSL